MSDDRRSLNSIDDIEFAVRRIEELEAKLAKALAGLKQCKEEIDDYIRQEYPQDHSLHERYRMRDFSANPARITLAALSKERSDEKGQDDAE